MHVPLRGDTKLLRVPQGPHQLSHKSFRILTFGPTAWLNSLDTLLEFAIELLWLAPRRGKLTASSPLFQSLCFAMVPNGCSCTPNFEPNNCGGGCCSRTVGCANPRGNMTLTPLKYLPLGCVVTPWLNPIPHDTSTLRWKVKVVF